MIEALNREVINKVMEDQKIQEQLLADLIYFVHKDDQEKTEADWASLGNFWRDRNEVKGLEACEIHLGRCNTCWERFQNILNRYKKRPIRN